MSATFPLRVSDNDNVTGPLVGSKGNDASPIKSLASCESSSITLMRTVRGSVVPSSAYQLPNWVVYMFRASNSSRSGPFFQSRQNVSRIFCSSLESSAWLRTVFSSERPQSNTWTLARPASAPPAKAARSRKACKARLLSGSAPPSQASATEEPIHIWGTGMDKVSLHSAASWPIASKRITSLYSTGRRLEASSPRGCRSAKSIQCIRNSSATKRWRANLLVFLPTFMRGQPPGSPDRMVSRASGGPSKPSRRKPWPAEFVTASMVLVCIHADNADLPCQPATAVTCPILTSNILHVW
mmetsp:Transcript_14462/g.39737  ORF Transcript_14462/g.39737 Transcript_14462/m.39737 type:complete len:298 (+) Transcript_14462:574-1467(+)